MGKLKQGINGPFTGKVGSVVGLILNDTNVMRGLPRKRTKPFSTKELHQQAKFKLMSSFLRQLIPFLHETFRPVAIHMTGYNKAFSYNVKNAIKGIQPFLSIDYSMLLLGRGDLPNADSPSAISSGDGKLEFRWTDNSGKGKAVANDKVFIAAYCEEMELWVYQIGLSLRSAASCIYDAGAFVGKSVQTYIGFMTKDGTDASETFYTGLVRI
jgi:hypothetical protein